VGTLATLDPTGITNLLKVFIQPTCDPGVALKDADKRMDNEANV